jgi:uncharacterized protein YjiS (DUF1127 family)
MEAAMNHTRTLASARHRPARPSNVFQRHDRPTTIGSIFSTWDERIRFRWDLEQMSRDNPHLIDDIGLTRRQVEAEIAKPFWQR